MIKHAIKVITFDLDDTLWECMPLIQKAESELRLWLEKTYPKITEQYNTSDFIKLRQEIALASPDFAHDFTYLRKTSLSIAAQKCGYNEDIVSEQGFTIFINSRSNVEFYDDVIPTLNNLKHRFRLGALTNGNVQFKNTGLNNIFDFHLNSIQAGSPKPSQIFFKKACKIANVNADEIVHVGDDPEHDVCGAKQAGMHTVWINRNNKPWPDIPPADATIYLLDELPNILDNWFQQIE